MNTFVIQEATLEDIVQVAQLEKIIEQDNAASMSTLAARQQMFPSGFLVAKDDQGKVVGYLESVLWQSRDFKTFAEIKNFPEYYDDNGNEIYIIFVAVAPEYRKQGIASALLSQIAKVAVEKGIQNLKLVAKDHLVPLYERNGFITSKELPGFLEYKSYKSFLMNKIV